MSLEKKLKQNNTNLNPVVRTNAYNIPGGNYNLPKASNTYGVFQPSGPLKYLDEKIVVNQLNSWDNNNTYLEGIKASSTINIPSIISTNASPPTQTKVDELLGSLKNSKDKAINSFKNKLKSNKPKSGGAFSGINTF